MSREKFYDLRRQGRAPVVLVIGGRLLVTREAEVQWAKSWVDCKK